MAENGQSSKLNPTARIAKNSLVQLVAGVLNKLLGVALVIYAARQLGTNGFGQYAYVLSLQAIFYIIADFGLGTLTTRDLSRDPDQDSRYFTNVLAVRVLLSLFAGGGMVAAAWLLGQPPAIVLLSAVAALSLMFTANVDSASAVFYAHQRMEIPSTVSVVVTTLRVTASLGALAAGAGVAALIWINTLSAVVHLIILAGILFYFIRPVFSLDPAFWRTLLREAAPLALANLFSVIYFRVDTVMLGSFRGQDAVGLYNAAYRLLELTLILPAYYGGAVFPVISASFGANPQRFQLIYRRSMKYMFVLSLPLALGTVALADRFIDVLYGAQYLASVPVLMVLMWTLVLIAVNSINAPYLIAMGRQRIVTVLVLAGMLFNVLANLWAIPRYGMLGAAWTTLASEVLTLAIFTGTLWRPLSLTPSLLRHLLRPALAGAAMYGLLMLIHAWELGFQILLAGAAYFCLLWVFRAFDEVDQELFSRVLRPTQPGNVKLT
ncbi:MAG: flippase [candidate division FCPU426 bacterium]